MIHKHQDINRNLSKNAFQYKNIERRYKASESQPNVSKNVS